MLRKAGLDIQGAPPGVPLFISSFNKPLASVCDVPGNGVKGLCVCFSPRDILIPFSWSFLVVRPWGCSSFAQTTLCWASGGRPGQVQLTSSDPTPEASDPHPAAFLGALSLEADPSSPPFPIPSAPTPPSAGIDPRERM